MFSIAGVSKTQQIRQDQQTAVLGGEENQEYEVTLPPVAKVAGKVFSLRTRRDVTQVKVKASGSDLDEVLGPNEARLFYSDGTRWWQIAQESVQDQGDAAEPEEQDETQTTEDTGFAAQQEYQTVGEQQEQQEQQEQRETETVDEEAQERPQEEVSPTPQQELERQEGAETSAHPEEDDSVAMESTGEEQPEDDSDSGDDESLEDRLKNL